MHYAEIIVHQNVLCLQQKTQKNLYSVRKLKKWCLDNYVSLTDVFYLPHGCSVTEIKLGQDSYQLLKSK